MEAPLDLYGNPIKPDFAGIKSRQYAVRKALLDLGFSFDSEYFLFEDNPSHRIFFIQVGHLNDFDDVYRILEALRTEANQTPASIALCNVIEERLKRLEKHYLKTTFELKVTPDNV